jgi:type II secretory pathway pseudopilin PulG
MKPNFAAAAAVLICCAILAIVALFGYSRYKAAQSENAAFRAQLQVGAQNQQNLLGTHMPAQLSAAENAPPPDATPTPPPAQQ